MKSPTFELTKLKDYDDAYIVWLHDWIKENAKTYFQKENEADSWQDFIRFPELETDRTHLCLTTEPFLVDRDIDGVHTYCICTISEKGRMATEKPVIEVSEIPYGIWKNGYYLLPLNTNNK